MIEEILEYQETDGRLKKIEKELMDSVERKKAKEAQNYLKDAEEKLKRMDASAATLYASFKKISADYAAAEPVIAGFSDESAVSENTGELAYMNKKVGQIAEQVTALDREMNAVMEKIRSLNASFESIRDNVPKARKIYTDNRQKFETLKKIKDEDINKLKEKLTALERKNDPKLLSAYKRLSQQNIYPAAVELYDKNRCGGCRMDISMSAVGKIDADKYILCDNCGRIVYKK